jgi:hypothetical protein
MVALKTEPLTDNLSIGQLAKYDSKANMLDTFRMIGVGVTKSWDKSSLATCMDMVFGQSPRKRGDGSCFRATDGSRITVNGSRLMVLSKESD